MSPSSRAASSLVKDPIISRSLNESLARMLRNVHERQFKAGEVIYSADTEAKFLYLLHQGSVQLASPTGKRVTLDSTRFGEEAATDVPHYLSDAIALTDVVAFAIPRASLAGLNQYNPGHKAEFYFSLLANFGGERIRRRVGAPAAEHGHGKDTIQAVGWFAAIALPLVVLLYGRDIGLDRETSVFLAIFSATVVMWVFELVDEYIPGLFAVLVTLALGLAPTKIVLAGFASDGFFMAMSILGLGTVVVLSGLSFRFLLWLLRYLPNTAAGHNFGLLLTGFLLTPIVPSINARAVLVAPFLIDMVETVKFEFRGKAATRLAIAAFTGATLLSACFMTSRSVNFVIFGLLSPQQQEHFQWLYWVFASAGAAIAMLLVYFIAVAIAFPSREVSRLSKDQVKVQLSLLGPIKNREWAAIAGVLIFALGVVTTSVHNIQPPWMGMAILYGLLLFGSLRKNEFREKTDWPSLIYLGSLVGILNVFSYFGLDKWIGVHLAGVGEVMRTDFSLFVAILFGVVLLMRFVIPNTATIALCATVFMPIASQAGINPWVIGFILLLLGDLWLLPYQCPHYQQFQELIREKGVYDERGFLKFNLFMNLVRLGGIYASIPFWTALGLL
jgi:divalent anion:Na+ symporter, DASS family